MFPRRTRPPSPFGQMGRPQQRQNYLAMFQDNNGQFDIGKVMGTAHEINKIYHTIKPTISKFMK